VVLGQGVVFAGLLQLFFDGVQKRVQPRLLMGGRKCEHATRLEKVKDALQTRQGVAHRVEHIDHHGRVEGALNFGSKVSRMTTEALTIVTERGLKCRSRSFSSIDRLFSMAVTRLSPVTRAAVTLPVPAPRSSTVRPPSGTTAIT